MEDSRLSVVLVTALVDSINPCAIGVLILLISTLMSMAQDRKKMLVVGAIYVLAVFVAYFVAGVVLIRLLILLPFDFAQFIGMLVGGIVVLLGLLEIKEAFFHKEGKAKLLAIKPEHAEKIKKMMKKVTVPGVITLGFFVAAVELPCTGGPYLAITAVLAKNFDWMAFGYLVLYNFIFVLPLIIIVLLAYWGTSIEKLKHWKDTNNKTMRLATGLLMIGLGVLLVLFAADVISLGSIS